MTYLARSGCLLADFFHVNMKKWLIGNIYLAENCYGNKLWSILVGMMGDLAIGELKGAAVRCVGSAASI